MIALKISMVATPDYNSLTLIYETKTENVYEDFNKDKERNI